jgi:uncharacterized membrane protein
MKWLRGLPALIQRNRLDTLLAVAIGVLAVGLRLFALDRRSLWLDEIYQARCITPDWNFLLTCLRGYGNEPPLPYAATFLWYRLAGSASLPQPDWFMRLPAVLAGILCIPVAWRLGDALLGRRGAWLLALLWSVLPVAIDASQQVRQYSWFLLFCLTSTLFLILALKRGRLVHWVGWGISAALAMLSSYTTLLFLAGQGAFTLAWIALQVRSSSQNLPQRTSITKHLVGGLVGIVAGLIVLAFGYEDILGFFRQMSQSTAVVPFTSLNGSYLAGMSTWLLWGQMAWWDIQYWSASGESVLVLGVLVLLGLVWLASRERMTLLLVLGLFLSPLIYLFLGKGIPATPRFLLYLLVPYSLILIAGLLACVEWLTRLFSKFATPLRANRILTASGALLIVISLAPKLNDYYTAPYDNWREAAAYIQAHAGPSDAILSFGKTFAFIPAHALQYYLPSPPRTLTIADLSSLTRPEISRLESRQGQAWGVVWNDGSFTQERLTQWSETDFAVVPFGGFTLLAPRAASGTTLASGAASLVVHFHELMSNVPDEIKLGLLYNAGGENLVQNPAFSLDSAGRVIDWDVYGTTVRVSKETDISSLMISSSEVNENVNAIQRILLKPNENYVFRFECRNQLTEGTQRVFVTFPQPGGAMQAFPDGGGFICGKGMTWHSGKIVFRVPPPDQANPLATIWLRNYGIGDIYFRNLVLSQIPSAE